MAQGKEPRRAGSVGGRPERIGGAHDVRPRNDTDRRALATLAENPDGCSRGFPLTLFNRLVRAGLATSRLEREERGSKEIEIVRVKITEAGRRAL